MPPSSLPAWLRQPENYQPRSDREAFLEKSIKGSLGLLSRLRKEGRGRLGETGGLPLLLASAFLMILLVSLSGKDSFLAIAGTAFLVLLAFQPAEIIKTVFKACLPVAGFTALALIPSALAGNLRHSLALVAKVLFSVSLVVLLSASLPSSRLFGSLKAFHVPDLFILVLDMTVRYIFLLADLSLAMLYALRLRSVGRNDGKVSSMSGIAGSIFLTSRAMSEELAEAMACRGFTGDYASPAFRFRLGIPGLAALAADLLFLGLYFFLPGA